MHDHDDPHKCSRCSPVLRDVRTELRKLSGQPPLTPIEHALTELCDWGVQVFRPTQREAKA